MVELALYDEDVTGNELVATAALDLQEHGQACPTDDAFYAPLELPLVFDSDKKSQKRAKSAKNACLQVQVGAVVSWTGSAAAGRATL